MSRNSARRQASPAAPWITCITVLCLWVAPFCKSSDPVGTWEIQEASTEKGTSYMGVINVTPGTGGLHVVWNTSIDDHEGPGILMGKSLYACYAQRHEPCLLLVVPSQGPASSLEASGLTLLELDRGNPDAVVIRGTSDRVDLKPLGAGFSALMLRNGKKIEGAGLRAGSTLVLGFGPAAGAAEYAMSGSVHGRRFALDTGLRTEKLERAAVGELNVKFKGKFK